MAQAGGADGLGGAVRWPRPAQEHTQKRKEWGKQEDRDSTLRRPEVTSVTQHVETLPRQFSQCGILSRVQEFRTIFAADNTSGSPGQNDQKQTTVSRVHRLWTSGGVQCYRLTKGVCEGLGIVGLISVFGGPRININLVQDREWRYCSTSRQELRGSKTMRNAAGLPSRRSRERPVQPTCGRSTSVGAHMKELLVELPFLYQESGHELAPQLQGASSLRSACVPYQLRPPLRCCFQGDVGTIGPCPSVR